MANVGTGEGSSASVVAARPAVRRASMPEQTVKIVDPEKQTNKQTLRPADAAATQKAVAEGIKNPERARSVLEIIAKGLNKFSTEGSRQMFLKFSITEEDLNALKKSENPANKALGYDFHIALLQNQIALLEAKDPWKGKNNDPDYEVNKIKTYCQKQIVGLRSERGKIIDKDGNPISPESQIDNFAEKFAKSDDEKEQAKNDPISLLEKKFNAAVRSKEGKNDLDQVIQSIKQGLPEGDQHEIDELSKGIEDTIKGTISAERKKVIKNLEKKALMTGGGVSILMLLFAWLAMKKSQGGQQAMG